MEGEVKVYKITGRFMLSHDNMPEWRKFVTYVRALKKEDALEKVYSDYGSHHKLKRYHIKVESVEEVTIDEVEDRYVVDLSNAVRVR